MSLYRCECGRIFKSKFALEYHITRRLCGTAPPQIFVCPDCEKAFKSWKSLEYHRQRECDGVKPDKKVKRARGSKKVSNIDLAFPLDPDAVRKMSRRE